jgi:hypothetical protein
LPESSPPLLDCRTRWTFCCRFLGCKSGGNLPARYPSAVANVPRIRHSWQLVSNAGVVIELYGGNDFTGTLSFSICKSLNTNCLLEARVGIERTLGIVIPLETAISIRNKNGTFYDSTAALNNYSVFGSSNCKSLASNSPISRVAANSCSQKLFRSFCSWSIR